MFIYVIFSPLVWDSQMWQCFVRTLAEIQRQNDQRCEQEIEDLMWEIRARNITPNTSLIRFSDDARGEQKHSIRIADEQVALAVQAYDLVCQMWILCIDI